MQEPTRWPLSARLNITIGRHERRLDTAEVHEAARAGDAHEFVDGAAAGSTTRCCPGTSPTVRTCPAGSGSGWR